jgi:hypothetical protein
VGNRLVIARSRRASKDARLSTGYGDVAIQKAVRRPRLLDCFPPDWIRGSQ